MYTFAVVKASLHPSKPHLLTAEPERDKTTFCLSAAPRCSEEDCREVSLSACYKASVVAAMVHAQKN